MMNWIAKIGQNPRFVAFWAYVGVSLLVVERSPYKAAVLLAFYAVMAIWGDNIQVTAFFAHGGVAGLIAEHLPHQFIVAGAIIVAGGIKEFYFDAKYEKDPPQTFIDNLEDWSGWSVGAIVGAVLHG
jgi:hypothetical protein